MTNRRSFAALLPLAALLLASLAACRRSAPPAGGDAGNEPRVVSISPSTTEALFAIGAGKQVVGRSRYCDYPPEALALPQVGGYVDPSYEAILALRPTLVTGARGPSGAALTDKLDARGVGTFFPRTETFAEIDAMLLGLGERTGHGAEAHARVAAIDAQISGIEKALAGKPRTRVLVVFGLEPISVAGPGGFADEMIRRAGGANVVTEGGAYPMLGVERVITLDPDLVVNAAMAEAPGKDRINQDTPGWSKVRAVGAGHVVRLTEETVLRPGPRIGDGLATLARALHPDVALP